MVSERTLGMMARAIRVSSARESWTGEVARRMPIARKSIRVTGRGQCIMAQESYCCRMTAVPTSVLFAMGTFMERGCESGRRVMFTRGNGGMAYNMATADIRTRKGGNIKGYGETERMW